MLRRRWWALFRFPLFRSGRFRSAPTLYCIVDVRLITFRSATLERPVRISSCTPSAKKAFSFSSLKFSKGRTAMLFSGIGAGALVTIAPGAATAADDRDLGWKKINELTTSAIVDTSKATISTNLGERGALIGRTAPGACFHLLRLSFSGTCGLPTSSV